MTPANPDTGAAELMSPGSIGAPGSPPATIPEDYTGTTAVDWMRYLMRKGWATLPPTPPKMPGYIAPAPVMIAVPNATFGVKDGGTTHFPSIESALQRAVQGLAGTIYTQTWSDARVSGFLSAIAFDSDAWNGDADPGAKNIPALIAEYTQVYRVAVTPV